MSSQGGRCATGLSLFSRCEIKTDGARREHRVLEFALSPCARTPRGTWSPLTVLQCVDDLHTPRHMHRHTLTHKNNLEKNS